MKYLISNLKANFTQNEIDLYAEQIMRIPKTNFQLIVCPSNVFLTSFNDSLCKLGAQDVSKYDKGAYTGEVSARQLKSVGVEYVIIGHYERKLYFHESNETIISKMHNALNTGLQVIYCIGESLNEINNDEILHSLEKQIGLLCDFTHEELKNVIIAYEPFWAIGSNKLPDNDTIKTIIKFIKNLINDYYELQLSVVYGGSINRANIILLRNIKELDGFMIGASALNTDELKRITELAKFDNN